MGFNNANPDRLKDLGRRAEAALASGDPAEAQKVVQDLAAEVGPDGLTEIWKSGA